MSIDESTELCCLHPTEDGACGQVLIAEDDAMFRRILQIWLENWGYQVVVAEDGAKAWGILQQERPPELLVLDWVMPEVDGTELCRRIREQQSPTYQYGCPGKLVTKSTNRWYQKLCNKATHRNVAIGNIVPGSYTPVLAKHFEALLSRRHSRCPEKFAPGTLRVKI